MAAASISQSDSSSPSVDLRGELLPPLTQDAKSPDWTHFAAAGAVLAGGLLIASGRRRAGMAVAAVGTALALVEEQDAVKLWWKRLPVFLDQAQHFLDKAEGYLKEATVQGHRLQDLLRR